MLHTVLTRQLGALHISRRVLLESMCCDVTKDAVQVGPAPVFAAQFAPRSSTLAVGDEDGWITVLDTAESRSGGIASTSSQFSCHANAIFDVAWVAEQEQLLTTSGDQTVRLFDMREQTELRCFRGGHNGSVKTISSLDASIFASGGRDGNICVWDARVPQARPTFIVPGAHETPMPGKRKRAGGLAGASAPSAAVSCVCFVHDASAKLATGGATDGLIKIWDLRSLSSSSGSSARATSKARAPAPFQVLRPPVAGNARTRGITSLAVDPSGSRLLATTTNSIVYLYDTRWCATPREAPGSTAAASTGRSGAAVGGGDNGASESVAQFSGHRVESFYVKTRFSPDGEHILSGSSDGGVYVWEAARPSAPPVVLWGHSTEVTAVEWCPTDFTTLVSTSDDAALRVWRVDREGGRAAQRMAELHHSPHVMRTPTARTASAAPDDARHTPCAETPTSSASGHSGSEASTSTAVPMPPPSPMAPPPPPPPPPPPTSQVQQPARTPQRDVTLRSWLVPRPPPGSSNEP